jgi:hypothetical protein
MTVRLHTAALAACALALAGVAQTTAAHAAGPADAAVDCSEAYGPGKAAACHVVPCDGPYAVFVGEWSGPFEEYVQGQSKPGAPVFRPYDDRITYAAHDCLINAANGDRFIIGRRTDSYPAFGALPAQTKRGLLITGRHGDGAPFLRTVDSDGINDYALVSKDAASETAVWRLDVPAANGQPALSFMINDGRDQALKPRNVRNVTIDMTVGPAERPYFHAVVTRGHHELKAG